MSDLPGLPNLAEDVSDLFSEVIALTSDVIGVGGSPSQWGIFLNGNPVVLADNVVSLEYKQDFSISNYPVEQGSFASYNKVQRPSEVRLRFSTGGSVADRQAFLDSIAAIIGDTNLYDVVTPEETYSNQNLIRQGYVRHANEGLGLVVVDVSCQEVRPASLATSSTTTTANTGNASADTSIVSTDAAQIVDPQQPGASSYVNGGNLQPIAPTSLQQGDATQAMANGPYRGPNLGPLTPGS